MPRGLVVRLFSVSLAAIPTIVFAAQETKKPVVVDEFDVYREAPPATLAAMWREAEAVAVVKVLSAAPRPAPPDPLLIRPRLGFDTTTYKADVVEVLKDDRVHLTGVGGIVNVHREHGETDDGKYIIRRLEKGFFAFVIGHTYVLFVNWNDHMKLFVVAYGPDAAYDITNGLIQTPGQGAVAREMDGQPAEQLLTRLRAIKKARQR